MALHQPTDVDSPELTDDRAWRRARTLVTVLTFVGVVLVLTAIDDDPGALALTITLPLVLGVLGAVLRLARPRSPLGHGLVRGAGLVLVLYAAGMLMVLISLVG